MTRTSQTMKGQKKGEEKKTSTPKKEKKHRASFPSLTPETDLCREDALLRLASEATSDVAWVMNPNGTFRCFSPSVVGLLGYPVKEALSLRLEDLLTPASFDAAKKMIGGAVISEGSGSEDAPRIRMGEFEMIRKDGTRRWVESKFTFHVNQQGQLDQIVGVSHDITDRMRLEQQRDDVLKLLAILQQSSGTKDLARSLGVFLQNMSGCEAVGIRLRDGEDFPYYETSGFPPAFVLAENRLCAVDEKGEMLRDNVGNPVIECMCGNILCGRFNPELPFFTQRGSFWSNCTTELLASTSEADRQARTRNRCNGEGYESVALIALRACGETYGLLQFNDRRRGRFTPEFIEFLEQAADHIALSFSQRLVQASLDRAAERYRIVADNTYDWELWWGAENKMLYCSPSCERLTGYDREAFMADAGLLERIVHPDDRDAYLRHREAHRWERAPGEFEFRIVRSDGETRWVGHTCQPVFDSGGRFMGTRASNRDITKSKQVEEKLRHSEKRFRTLFNGMTSGVTVYQPEGGGDDFLLTDMNEAGLRICAATHGQVTGRRVTELFPAVRESGILDAFRMVWQTGEPRCVPATRYDDGRIAFWVENRVYRLPGGEIVAVFDDVTARKEAEQSLRDSEELFSKAFHCGPLSMIISDIHTGRYLEVNENFVNSSGYSRDEAIGTTSVDLGWITPEDRELLKNEILADGKVAGRELELKKKTGGKIKCLYFGEVINVAGENRLLSIMQDITERKMTEEALRKSEERFRLIASSTPDHLIVQGSDLRYSLVINPQLGLTELDMIGKTDHDFLSKEDADELTKIKAQVLETGRPVCLEQSLLSRTGGQEIFDGSFVPTCDADGRVDGLIGYFRNVTGHKQSEAAIRESEQRYRSLFENSIDGILMTIPDGKIIDANPAACAMFGMTRDEICRAGRDDLVENDARLAYAIQERELRGRFRSELTFIRKNGTRFTGEATSVTLPDNAGTSRSFVMIRDITMHRLAIDALSDSENLFRTLSEKSMAGIYVVQDGVFKLVNPNAASYCERSPEDMVGAPSDRIIHPDDREPARRNAVAMLKGEISSPYEFRVVTPHDETRWILETVTSIVYEGKQAILGNSMDITVLKLAAEALRLSEEKYRQIVDMASEGVWAMDGKRLTTFTNARMAEMLGCDADEMIGRPVEAFMFEDDLEDHAVRMQARARGKHARYEHRFRKKDGGTLWTIVSATALTDEEGRFAGSFAMFTDITDRKEAEAKLQSSHDLLKIAEQASSAGVWGWDMSTGTLTWSEEFCRLFGLEPSADASFETWLRVLHADDRESAVERINRSIRERTSLENDYRIVLPDGQLRWIGAHGNTRFDEAGQPKSMHGICFDITERKRADEALRKSEENFRLLAEHATDVISRHRPDGTTAYISPGSRSALGYEPDELAGRSVYDFVHPEDAEEFAKIHKTVLENSAPAMLSCRLQHKDGSWRWFETLAKGLRDDDTGAVAEIIAVTRDVSVRKLAEQEIRASEEKFSKAFLASPDLMAISTIGEGCYVDANEAFLTVLGFTREEIIGQTATGLNLWVNPADRDRLVDELRGSGRARNMEFTIRAKSGDLRTLLFSAETIELAGAPHMLSMARDITERKKAEGALRESEARFRHLVENAPDGIYVQTGGVIRYLNRAALRILGAGSQDQLIGQPFMDRVHPDFRERVKARARIIMEDKGRVPVQDQVYLQSDGTPVDVAVSVVPIHYSGEDGALVFLHDITEQKQAREALVKSEDQYRLLFDNMMSGFAVHEILCDQLGRPFDYRFLAVNGAFERLTGLRGADIIGRTAREVMPDLEDSWIERYGKVALEGKECHFEDYSGSLDKYFDIRAFSPERGKFAVLFHNITSRKRVEEALLKSEEQYRHIFENALEGIFRSTPEGRYLKVNPALARMFGYGSPEEMIDRITDIGRELYVDLDERARCIRILQEEGALRRFEVQMRRRDGSTMWTIINSRVVRDEAAAVLYIEGMISDISDLKRAEEALKESERRLRQAQKMEAIGTLAGGIAHDFNNILAAIIGYTEMSLCSSVTKKQILENLEHVLKAGLRAKDLIKQILAFSRQGDQELRPILIHPLLKEAAKMLRASLPATIQIRQNIRGGGGAILGDPTQIHQIVMNLATNAAHAMHEKGGTMGIELQAITLDAREAEAIHTDLHAGRHLRLTVSDTGHGIEPSVLHRIFDPFFTTKDPGEGTGMGLAVVHGIVKSHGGVITVDSEPGKGTEFRVYFPAMESEATRDASEAAMRDLGKGKGRVLFVDDEEALALLSGQLLSRLGYEVVTRTSSLEALEAFRANPDRFNLVITDQTMPQMTGIELAQEMMRIRPDIPIILCTGFSEAVTPEKAKSVGIREYLMKPLVMRQMADTISRILDTQGKLRLQYGTRTYN